MKELIPEITRIIEQASKEQWLYGAQIEEGPVLILGVRPNRPYPKVETDIKIRIMSATEFTAVNRRKTDEHIDKLWKMFQDEPWFLGVDGVGPITLLSRSSDASCILNVSNDVLGFPIKLQFTNPGWSPHVEATVKRLRYLHPNRSIKYDYKERKVRITSDEDLGITEFNGVNIRVVEKERSKPLIPFYKVDDNAGPNIQDLKTVRPIGVKPFRVEAKKLRKLPPDRMILDEQTAEMLQQMMNTIIYKNAEKLREDASRSLDAQLPIIQDPLYKIVDKPRFSEEACEEIKETLNSWRRESMRQNFQDLVQSPIPSIEEPISQHIVKPRRARDKKES